MPAKDEVIKQIRLMLQDGETIEAITRTLISAGWAKDEIIAVLKDAGAAYTEKTDETELTPTETDKENKKIGITAGQAKNETVSKPTAGITTPVVATAIVAVLLLIAGVSAYFLYLYLNGDSTQKLCNCDPKELNLICAKDGNTYKSECKLNCAKAEKDYDGECKKVIVPVISSTPKPTEGTPPTLTEIPEPIGTPSPTPVSQTGTATPTSFPFVIPPAGGNPSGGGMPPLPG